MEEAVEAEEVVEEAGEETHAVEDEIEVPAGADNLAGSFGIYY